MIDCRRIVLALIGASLLAGGSAGLAQKKKDPAILATSFISDRSLYRTGLPVTVGDIIYTTPSMWDDPAAAFTPKFHFKSPPIPISQDMPITDDLSIKSQTGIGATIPLLQIFGKAVGVSFKASKSITLKVPNGAYDAYDDTESASMAIQALQNTSNRPKGLGDVFARIKNDAKLANNDSHYTHYWMVVAVYRAKDFTWGSDKTKDFAIGLGCSTLPEASPLPSDPATTKKDDVAQTPGDGKPKPDAAATGTMQAAPTSGPAPSKPTFDLTGSASSKDGVAIGIKAGNTPSGAKPVSAPADAKPSLGKCGLGAASHADGTHATTTGKNVVYAIKLKPIFMHADGTFYLGDPSPTDKMLLPDTILRS